MTEKTTKRSPLKDENTSSLILKRVTDLEEQLAKSEARYNRLLNNLKEEYLFYRHDTKGNFTFVSPSYQNILGFKPEEYIGLSVHGLWTKNPINEEASRKTKLSMMGHRQPPYEMEILDSMGKPHIFVNIETPIFDEHGHVIAVEGTARDITEWRKIEEKLDNYRKNLEQQVEKRTIELRNSQKQLATLMGNLPGMAYRIVNDDSGWRVDFVSEGCRQIFYLEPSQLVGCRPEKLKRLIHPDDMERMLDIISQISNGARQIKCEYRIITSSDETKWVFDKAEVIHNADSGGISIEGFMADFTVYKDMEHKLLEENLLLRSTIRDRHKFVDIIGNCSAMQDVFDLILKAATSDDNVFIFGESGTGKELVAQAIHKSSHRKNGNFIPVNCAAIPENLIESEFFGTSKGAFTGANHDKKGYLETADGGTLFLDEIGDISQNLQVKLLRAIDGGGFCPVGSRRVVRPNLRIIAASNKNLEQLVESGAMRQDFFFRIHVIPIHIPPLRERGDDIFLLINHFLKRFSTTDTITSLGSNDLEVLKNHPWPGNIRELQNVLRRYITLKNLDFMRVTKTPDNIVSESTQKPMQLKNQPLKVSVTQYEKALILQTLSETRWNKTRAARELGISRKTLFRRMKASGLN